MSEHSLEGYRGDALRILSKAGAAEGSRIKVKTLGGEEIVGLLIPRYQHADEDHIVLKLRSGYNIGIEVASIVGLEILELPVQRVPGKPLAEQTSTSGKNVLLLSTGGTIASRVDYRTGAVFPALSAQDLYEVVPELGKIARIHPKVVFSTYSENLTPSHWQEISETIVAQISANSALNGIVVMLGTDTLGYVSAALSFSLLGLGVPVVCVGAQRSSDRPSSDSALNLEAAVRFAAFSGTPGVFVAMHKDEGDDVIAIHLGTRVRKNHTSRRDAFESIDAPLFAEVRGREIIPIGAPREENPKGHEIAGPQLKLKTKFERNVALVKFYPGFNEGLLDYLEERETKGIIIEGSGLGHVSKSMLGKISEISNNAIFIGITSQCIWGRVDLNVYETGRDLINAGAVPLENMLAESALAKVSWALGNFGRDMTKKIMLQNIAGEVTLRSLPEG